jgi:hypothetical protein
MRGIVFLLISFIFSSNLDASSADEAYAAIPHRRTVFEESASQLSKEELLSLRLLFEFCDQGVILKVRSSKNVNQSKWNEIQTDLNAYQKLIEDFNQQGLSTSLMQIKNLVVAAMKEHRTFFENKMKNKTANMTFTPEISSASQKLFSAYNQLMSLFPKESAHNKQAFYDYLCALDFM